MLSYTARVMDLRYFDWSISEYDPDSKRIEWGVHCYKCNRTEPLRGILGLSRADQDRLFNEAVEKHKKVCKH